MQFRKAANERGKKSVKTVPQSHGTAWSKFGLTSAFASVLEAAVASNRAFFFFKQLNHVLIITEFGSV